ncbi:GAF and ANTAR domain-containing protein [Arthrobacter sp. AFG20]|uniref:GAF and ANTAR domain-containing protein n=1 Tax=Arthrobacter sp. AFG20 TaxID=1688671 RepID=UPI000C9E06BD|nr:GAF and ANTAR domain-containing protein [Arthrobacter sp. AFG20]PNH85586.1 histidine kinase [Arthrobacter sp. AFG20]
MTEANEDAALLQLQDILIGADNVDGFLEGLAGFAAATLSGLAGTAIECAITLKRRRHTSTVAGSSPRAIELDHIEQRVGDGPCIRALFTMAPELLNDVQTDDRWPEYQKRLAENGVYSTLGVPLDIGEGASAALNFFGPAPGLFTPELFDRAVGFGELASRTMHLSVRIGAAQARAQNLEAAMQSRTAIDVACGVIMAQNRCSQQEAMDILAKVSSNRNQKLRDVAVELVGRLSGSGVETHFE